MIIDHSAQITTTHYMNSMVKCSVRSTSIVRYEKILTLTGQAAATTGKSSAATQKHYVRREHSIEANRTVTSTTISTTTIPIGIEINTTYARESVIMIGGSSIALSLPLSLFPLPGCTTN